MMKAKVLDVRGSIGGKRGAVIRKLEALIREYGLSYDEFVECSKIARERTELKRPGRSLVDKPIPTADEMKRFMQQAELTGSKEALMLKVLLYTGIRTCELVGIRVEDLDLTPGKERFYCRRKAGRDKTFNIPEKLGALVRMYVGTLQNPVYLFESGYHKPYTTRGIRDMVQRIREKAGVSEVVHPHNFRHFILTMAAEKGWTEYELKMLSGHDSSSSLARYTHRNPEVIREKQNTTLNQVGV